MKGWYSLSSHFESITAVDLLFSNVQPLMFNVDSDFLHMEALNGSDKWSTLILGLG